MMQFSGFWKKRNPVSLSDIRSILIVKLSAIGDVVHTLPLLEVLRENLPNARIDWLVEEEASEIIKGHAALNRVIVSRRKMWQKNFVGSGRTSTTLKEIVHFLRELRSEKYDTVIDIHGLLKSGLLTGLARGRRKIGFTWAREGSTLFLSEPPYFEDQYRQHAIERYLKTANILGCDVTSWKGRIPVGDSQGKTVNRLFRASGLNGNRIAAMNPMARWDTKLWEPERFARLADRIQEELGMSVLFTGSKEDRPIIQEICSGMKNGGAVNLAGRIGLKELASLYTRCDLLITTDTGPMHIAAAMDCPVIALFGPTAPWRTGPYGNGHKVIREDLGCSPCFKKTCSHKTCMKGITVGRVFHAVLKQLDRTAPEKPRIAGNRLASVLALR
jgi:3-deoxy-D-manno-octulosonic-acid transferase/heptosyltransferase-1